MSYVHRNIDGTYEVGVLYQDGHDRSTHLDRDSAIREYKLGMRVLGGLKEDIATIPDPKIVDKGAWPSVIAEPPNGITVDRAQVSDAIQLALNRQQLDPGSRYEFRVVLVKVDGAEPYVGEGI